VIYSYVNVVLSSGILSAIQ